MDQAGPVILEGIDKGVEPLVNLLVRVLRLTICLQIVSYRELESCAKEATELFPEG